MKKVLLASVLALVALTVITGVAGAQSTQPKTGTLHDYMEQAFATKLGIPLTTVEAQFDAGKTLYQIALDNGITQANKPAFLKGVRAEAIKAALADGIITQAQADRMSQRGGRAFGMGARMMGTGTGPCGGTGIQMSSGSYRGGRWQQTNQ